MKTYKIQMEIIGLAVFFTLFLVCFLFADIALKNPVTITFIIICWCFIPFSTYKIEIEEDLVRFSSLLRTIEVQHSDITSIAGTCKHYKVHHKSGSVIINPFMERHSELVTMLQSLVGTKYNQALKRTE